MLFSKKEGLKAGRKGEKMNKKTLQKILNFLTAEAEETEKQIGKLKTEIATSPDGSLLTSNSNGVSQFQYRTGPGPVVGYTFLKQKRN